MSADLDAALAALNDPEFFAYWSAARTMLTLTPEASGEYEGIRAKYDAAKVEYQRRMAPPEEPPRAAGGGDLRRPVRSF
jgi:hypothetical protein